MGRLRIGCRRFAAPATTAGRTGCRRWAPGPRWFRLTSNSASRWNSASARPHQLAGVHQPPRHRLTGITGCLPATSTSSWRADIGVLPTPVTRGLGRRPSATTSASASIPPPRRWSSPRPRQGSPAVPPLQWSHHAHQLRHRRKLTCDLPGVTPMNIVFKLMVQRRPGRQDLRQPGQGTLCRDADFIHNLKRDVGYKTPSLRHAHLKGPAPVGPSLCSNARPQGTTHDLRWIFALTTLLASPRRRRRTAAGLRHRTAPTELQRKFAPWVIPGRKTGREVVFVPVNDYAAVVGRWPPASWTWPGSGGFTVQAHRRADKVVPLVQRQEMPSSPPVHRQCRQRHRPTPGGLRVQLPSSHLQPPDAAPLPGRAGHQPGRDFTPSPSPAPTTPPSPGSPPARSPAGALKPPVWEKLVEGAGRNTTKVKVIWTTDPFDYNWTVRGDMDPALQKRDQSKPSSAWIGGARPGRILKLQRQPFIETKPELPGHRSRRHPGRPAGDRRRAGRGRLRLGQPHPYNRSTCR